MLPYSGSGKSTALRALEDVGFFCVDNLPVVLLPKLLEIQTDAASEISKVALVMDLRERYFLEKYAEIFARLKEEGHRIEILFLDASDESLLRRFRETMRAHPLNERGTVMEGISLERERLSALRAMADKIVDTSSFNVHQLKEVIQRYFMTSTAEKRLLVNLMSFGFRYGLPPEADIVLDVRFLPNPFESQDLEFHQIDPRRSLGLALAHSEERWGLDRLETAKLEPPANSRAHARSRLMREIQAKQQSYYLDWEAVEIPNRKRTRLWNPFQH